MSFLSRLARWNAPFLVRVLRELADGIEAMYPGSPKYGVMFFTTEGESFMAEMTVADDHAPLTASVTFLDAEGSPTTPDDAPQWSSSDEEVATVEATEDGLTATVTIGAPGAAVIAVQTTEANTGAIISAQGTLTVTAGDTASGEVTFTE
jgi:hypothetical protein